MKSQSWQSGEAQMQNSEGGEKVPADGAARTMEIESDVGGDGLNQWPTRQRDFEEPWGQTVESLVLHQIKIEVADRDVRQLNLELQPPPQPSPIEGIKLENQFSAQHSCAIIQHHWPANQLTWLSSESIST